MDAALTFVDEFWSWVDVVSAQFTSLFEISSEISEKLRISVFVPVWPLVESDVQ